ncbi:hypothetical protein VD0004_g8961 [Verticillium dahliae]|nr:hypothetical protein VD0004_g8961 [Verticillium dahliae]PNH67740.1 hypothetical protein VD0001_g7720 [Verticillium dahliae]
MFERLVRRESNIVVTVLDDSKASSGSPLSSIKGPHETMLEYSKNRFDL